MAKTTSTSGPAGRAPTTFDVDSVVAQFAEFGSFATALELDLVEHDGLRQLLSARAGVAAQLGHLESKILNAIEALGGNAESAAQSSSKDSVRAARRKTRRAKAAKTMPNATRKVASGQLSEEKFDQLAEAADKTSPEDVDGDPTLLETVSRQHGDNARKSIDKWVERKQTATKRESIRDRQRRLRKFSMGRGPNGTIWLNGKGDPISGLPFLRRWEAEKDRLWRADGGREGTEASGRTDEQRGWDALINCVNNVDGNVDTDVDPGQPLPDTQAEDPSQPCECGGRGQSPTPPIRHQILISANASLIDGTDPASVAELIGGGPLLRSELEYLACNSDLFGLLFDPTGSDPLWCGRRVRSVTDAQWRALVARDKHCVTCAADPSRCQAHHLIPWTAPAKGKTDIDKLTLQCFACHPRLHANNLTLYRRNDGTWATRPATKAETPAKRSPSKARQARYDAGPAKPEPPPRQTHGPPPGRDPTSDDAPPLFTT